MFFEPITLQKSQATFVDGGVRANNPVEQVLDEAELIWPGREIGCLLSIGTGVTLMQGFEPGKSRLDQVLRTLAEITTDAETKARDFKTVNQQGKRLYSDKRYFRYSVPQWVSSVDLSDFEKIPYMESMTVPYVLDHVDSLSSCGQALANPIRAGQ